MSLNTWLARRGASGFTSSLLLLYTDAVGNNIEGEKQRWEYVLSNGDSLPIPLNTSNKKAIQKIIKDWDFLFKNNPTPQEVIESLVICDASISSGVSLPMEYMTALHEGARERIEIFRKKFPNRALMLESIQDKIVDVPVEVSDTLCPHCNQPMIIKDGRSGKFLACPQKDNRS